MTGGASVPSPAPRLPGQGLRGTSLPVIQVGQWASRGIASPVSLCGLRPLRVTYTPAGHAWLLVLASWTSQVAQLVKNLPANARDTREEGSIRGSGKISWSSKWKPTPVFLPEFRSLAATVHGVAELDTEEKTHP